MGLLSVECAESQNVLEVKSVLFKLNIRDSLSSTAGLVPTAKHPHKYTNYWNYHLQTQSSTLKTVICQPDCSIVRGQSELECGAENLWGLHRPVRDFLCHPKEISGPSPCQSQSIIFGILRFKMMNMIGSTVELHSIQIKALLPTFCTRCRPNHKETTNLASTRCSLIAFTLLKNGNPYAYDRRL